MAYESLQAKVSALLQKDMKRLQVPGVSLALVDGQETAWATGLGFADRQGHRPVNAETIFMIGSITKLFTATAIMQQVELGRINLDHPVQEYIPEFSIQSRFPDAPAIKVRHLMTHHSGIPCDNIRRMWAKSIDETPDSFHEVLDFLRGHYLASPPGRIFAYSNQAVSLLGVVLERVSGEPYEKYIRTHIFEPLRMETATFFPDDQARLLLSKGYSKPSGEWEGRTRETPAGGIYASAQDMSRFLAMVNGQGSLGENRILRPETLAEMFRPQNEGEALDFGFKIGLNWILSLPPLETAGTVGWHDGGTRSFTSNLIVLPEQRLGVIILSNSPAGGSLTHRVSEEILKLALQEGRGINPGAKQTLDHPLPTATKSSLSELNSFIGEYPSFSMGLITLQRGGRMNVRGLPLKMVNEREGWYSLRMRLLGGLTLGLKPLAKIRATFREIDGRKVFAIDQDGFRIAVAEQTSRSPIPEAWAKRAGRYLNLEQDNPSITQAELKCTRDMLTLEAKVRRVGNLRLFLRPVNDREAVIAGLGRFTGETVTAKEVDGVAAIDVEGCLFKRQ